VQEGHFGAVRAGARGLVDRRDAGGSRLRQRALQVGHLEAHVMEPGPARFEEARHGMLGRAWLEQLDRHRAQVHEDDAQRAAIEQLVLAAASAEGGDQPLGDGIRLAHRQRDVRQASHQRLAHRAEGR
jgi:hypothetical protein